MNSKMAQPSSLGNPGLILRTHMKVDGESQSSSDFHMCVTNCTRPQKGCTTSHAMPLPFNSKYNNNDAIMHKYKRKKKYQGHDAL